MTKQERFDAMLADLNSTTNDIAEDYAKLLAEAQAGTVSEESISKGEANVAALKLLASQVPNEPPVVPGEGDGGTGEPGDGGQEP